MNRRITSTVLVMTSDMATLFCMYRIGTPQPLGIEIQLGVAMIASAPLKSRILSLLERVTNLFSLDRWVLTRGAGLVEDSFFRTPYSRACRMQGNVLTHAPT